MSGEQFEEQALYGDLNNEGAVVNNDIAAEAEGGAAGDGASGAANESASAAGDDGSASESPNISSGQPVNTSDQLASGIEDTRQRMTEIINQ
ncbi:hypothetical protein Esi_0291_0035 [Ectocarpus siliculosus]|uniref:Uncharacterized protein n=1 Tax=Ectocarpus siliculosus TaxID=2880 RepID=D7FVJ4_ECTSI|nr:hypothetical protein Esi_0291_0035 [Ectocarpus siliculosus]|eukprot:CBJ31915.1 hypothetical protein Esi_0291_0035 [Ectocarpus siliculosus]